MFRTIGVLILASSTFIFAQSNTPQHNAAKPNAAKTEAAKPEAPKDVFTLTVQVEGVNSQGGNVGVLVFNSTKGWPDDIHLALKDIVVPAHPGTVTVKVEGLPAGTYAVAVGHDVNMNHKVDKNFFGVPKEQWGMSNNPRAMVKPPSFNTAHFDLKGDSEITVRMQ